MPFSMNLRSAGIGLFLLTFFGASTSLSHADSAIAYNRDIRPILAEHCFRCHGPDSASRQAELRLDRREAAIEGAVIVPGKPEESKLIERIESNDPEAVMPPPEIHKDLSAEQKAILKQWIAAGAEYQPHWSLIPPKRPALPVVEDERWSKTPIDRFILARLEAASLAPAPEADRRTLARRASLDLIGLPPEPQWVEEYVADVSSDAYEKYVDRLLALPQWGEHRGRYWLDAARFADSHGIHFDNYREMWSYRDWVIKAFNQNMRFDQFTIEQLAGDLLPNHTLDQQIGSGFNRCNITTSEGGAIDEEYLVLYARDRTEATSQVWLGLTTGCAVCHDHKFDPISQREFYELSAFFNNTTQRAMDGNAQDTPPIVRVPLDEDRPKIEALTVELAEARKQIADYKQSARKDFDQWLQKASVADFPTLRKDLVPALHAQLSEGTEHTLDFLIDNQVRPVNAGNLTWEEGHVAPKALKLNQAVTADLADFGDFERDQPFTMAAWIKITEPAQVGVIMARMDEKNGARGWDFYCENNRIGMHFVHHWPEDGFKVVAKKEVPLGQWHHVSVVYDGSSKVSGAKVYYDGVLQEVNTEGSGEIKDTVRTNVAWRLAQRSDFYQLTNTLLQDVRVYTSALTADEITSLGKYQRLAQLLSKPQAERSAPEADELYQYWLTGVDKAFPELSKQETDLLQKETDIYKRGTIAHVMYEKNDPAKAFVLFRGEYDKRRDEVVPTIPAVLPPMPSDLPRNRLGLAKWLLLPDHPLTTRVTVNRFWQELFSTGIVRTAGDLGVSGEQPSHPELLDWMAVEFRESGWDVKRFYRLLVTSATYRQAATITPEKLEKDGANRLLSRGPRFRMDGEMIRDYALASSGLLVRKFGGPSVKPYQPDGVWEAVAMPGSNTRDYKQDQGDGLYRRSVYTFWKRSAPPASMEIFNAPNREVCTVRRERTNTPLQALVTLNDTQFVEAARHLAQRALQEGGQSPDAQLDFVARRLLARPLQPSEATIIRGSLDSLLAYYQEHVSEAQALLQVGESKSPADLNPSTLAGWTMLVNELMNLDEVVTK